MIIASSTGRRIGWPYEAVDVENAGTPVAIDTAGNVSNSRYENNRFDEINGKCFDLDGFHDGVQRDVMYAGLSRARDELVSALRETWSQGEPWLVLGGGSNLLAGDEPFDGTVVLMRTCGFGFLPGPLKYSVDSNPSNRL